VRVCLRTQFGFFRRRFRGVILFQVGRYFELFDRDAVWASAALGMTRIAARPGFYARCGVHRMRCRLMIKRLMTAQRDILIVAQTGMPHGSLKTRMGVALFFTQLCPKQD
jgi:DNA mismatch repair ATPase MutS